MTPMFMMMMMMMMMITSYMSHNAFHVTVVPPKTIMMSSSVDHPLLSSAVEIEIGKKMAITPIIDVSSKGTISILNSSIW